MRTEDPSDRFVVSKVESRGYLRCAKCLLLDGKPEKALELYAYALKTLPSNNPRRELVEQLHNKLRDKLTSKYRDPFSVLPLEIAAMVLEHLDFKQIVYVAQIAVSRPILIVILKGHPSCIQTMGRFPILNAKLMDAD
ncbi:hypothetical protein APSETT445_004319 [Aspergillus pseudonomiae]